MKLKPVTGSRADANQTALENENAVLLQVAAFGHLRIAELAALVWPTSPPASAKEMARRTVRRLVQHKELLVRRNSLGGESFVLTRKSALRATDLAGHAVGDGYDIQGVAGPTFWHRTLGTSYLAHRLKTEAGVWGEYSLARAWAPLSALECARRFGKIPDGLVRLSTERTRKLGLAPGVAAYQWIEVESSFKPKAELEKSLRLAECLEEPLGEGVLVGLVFVLDRCERHEACIRRVAARILPKQIELMSFKTAFEAVSIARCELARPLSLRSVEEITLACDQPL